jgi:hypothetical protein
MTFVSRAILLALAFVGCSTAAAQTITAEPRDRTARFGERPEFVGRGTTMSAAAKAAQAACNCLQDIALNVELTRSLKALNSRVVTTLDNTGQPGVLLHGEVASIRGPIDRYFLVGGKLQFIGAGKAPGEVYTLANSKPRLKPDPPDGASVDTERSLFFWVSRPNKEFIVVTLPANTVLSEERRYKSDKILFAKLAETAKQEAIAATMMQMQKDIDDKKLREKIAELRGRTDAAIKKLEKIEADLAKEQEKVRKAQATYANLQLTATILTVAQMASNAYSSLGKDAPAGVENAKSSQDLLDVVQGVSQSAQQRKDQLSVEYNKVVNEKSGIQVEQLNIIRGRRIQTEDIPALPRLTE